MFSLQIIRSALNVINTHFLPSVVDVAVRRDGGAGETTRLQRLLLPQHHRLLLPGSLGLQVRITVIAVR